MIRRIRPALGTYVEITAEVQPAAPLAKAAVDAAFLAVERVTREMSFHDPTSGLSRLNRSAHREEQAVSPWLMRVLRTARELHRLSGGVFDPAVGARLVRAGLLPEPEGAPAPDLDASYADVLLLGDDRVRFSRPLWLDLGGIAKGFAVDVAVLTLRRFGVRQACVNAGGDLRVFGPEPQPILRRQPGQPSSAVEIGRLSNGACATSAGYFATGGAGDWAIVHPGGGHVQRDESVTVIAPRCLWADALTKVAALMPAAECVPLIRHFHAHLVPA